jgi:hypothetical protein
MNGTFRGIQARSLNVQFFAIYRHCAKNRLKQSKHWSMQYSRHNITSVNNFFKRICLKNTAAEYKNNRTVTISETVLAKKLRETQWVERYDEILFFWNCCMR